jgi:hypothetical protein
VVKPFSAKPSVSTTNGADSAHSGVQLSREALYEQRMAEIYEDVQSGRCGFEEATDRVVEAILACSGDWFTDRGRVEFEAHVRQSCATDPRLRKALGG